MRKINPRLVYVSLSGFGQDGPYGNRPGFDQIAQGMGGLMSITGLPGQGPVRVGIPIADLSGGNYAAMGALIALHRARRLGRRASGCRPRCCRRRSPCSTSRRRAGRWRARCPGQAGNDHPTGIPTGVFPTSDGHINIAASGQHIYERCCKALGAESLIKDPDFANGEKRSKNRKRLNAELGEFTKRYTSAELVEKLNAAGVPSGADLQLSTRCSPTRRWSTCGMAVPIAASDAGAGGDRQPGGGTLAHALRHRPPDAGARRAHGRRAGRSRLQRATPSPTFAAAR